MRVEVMESVKKFLLWLAASRFGIWIMKNVFSRLDPVLYRLSGGRFTATGPVLIPYLILNTTGRKSGQKRSIQLVYTDVDGDPHVVASNFGQEHHPAWFYNLVAQPEVTIELGSETIPVQAVRLSGEEGEAVWDTLVANVPNYALYKARAVREINIFRFERRVEEATA